MHQLKPRGTRREHQDTRGIKLYLQHRPITGLRKLNVNLPTKAAAKRINTVEFKTAKQIRVGGHIQHTCPAPALAQACNLPEQTAEAATHAAAGILVDKTSEAFAQSFGHCIGPFK